MNHNHSWTVFSTALAEHALLVQCQTCGAFGSIDNPTKPEWTRAFHAPSNPYPWSDDKRVTIRVAGYHEILQ